MNFYIMTLFPDMVMQGLSTSIIGRAKDRGLLSIEAVNIRDYTLERHKKVDDYPYGGGAGMLMQAQPVYDAWKSVVDRIGYKPRTVYLTPQGPTFTQPMAKDLAQEKDLILLCGHYEGIDERVLEEIVTDYVSIGDYVLTGGELPAMVMVDAISRMVPARAGFVHRRGAFHRRLYSDRRRAGRDGAGGLRGAACAGRARLRGERADGELFFRSAGISAVQPPGRVDGEKSSFHPVVR